MLKKRILRDSISKNKTMPKQTKKHLKKSLLCARSVLLILLAFGVGFSSVQQVRADQFDDQINALQSLNNENRNLVNGLASQARSYEDAINQLQSQINALQAALNANLAQQASLNQQIIDAQNKIDQQKAYLAENIRTMYVEGQLSTIEELATSKNLSEYVDKQEYRTRVQNKINTTIKEIAVLQAQLKQQKSELDVLVASQQQQNQQLASAQAEQQQMLAYNEGQRAAYNSQINANSSKIAELKRQQIAANARFSGGAPGTGPACGGGYPGKWCNIPMDSVIDSWGMYNRECVSYTAWKVASTGRYMPYWGGYGNANQWDDNARNAGIPVDTNPRPGDVAISNSGYYGHSMYVESVNLNGTINVSQYNASWDGRYSERYNMSPAGLVFIHF